MYPSGTWIGFWEQSSFGRQAMREFELHFRPDGTVSGHGVDVVGRFVYDGEWDPKTGRVTMTKQYLKKHRVRYEGAPDGEGSILGTWTIDGDESGPFGMSPHLPRPTGDEPILEIRK
jgi:hypothetical protein